MRQLCLPPKLADAFKKAIEDGVLDVDDLATKSSDERKKVFNEYIKDPELLQKFNKGFEERAVVSAENIEAKKQAIIDRLTKKNQEEKIPQALADYEIKLVKRQTELLNRYLEKSLQGVPVNRKKNVVERVKATKHLLTPGEQKVFLEDLVAQKLGYGVDLKTAEELVELSNKVQADAEIAESVISQISRVARTQIESKIAEKGLDITVANKEGITKFLTNLVDDTTAKGINTDKKLIKQGIKSTIAKITNDAELVGQFNRYIDSRVNEYTRRIWDGELDVTDDFAEIFKITPEDIDILATRLPSVKVTNLANRPAVFKRMQLAFNQQRLLEKYSSLKENMVEDSINALVDSGQMTVREGRARKTKEFALAVAEGAKSSSGSLDFSFLGRQGWGALFTHPVMSFRSLGTAMAEGARVAKNMKRIPDTKEMAGLLNSMKRAFASKDPLSTMTLIDLDVASRYNAINGKYARASNGYGIGVGEEFFPSTWPERVPALGRLYKLTEIAYSGTARKMRADLADTFIERLEMGGHNVMDKKIADELGLLVGAMTGRGKVIGSTRLEKSPEVATFLNLALWSPRLIGSVFHFLYSPFKFGIDYGMKGKAGANPVLAISAQNTIQTLASAAVTVLAIKETANAFGVETKFDYNPRSSQFGTLTIGDASFDVSGGRAAAVSLLGRMYDYMDGEIYDPKLGIDKAAGFGQDSYTVLANFFYNRTSPAFSVLKTMFTGKSFDGEEMWRSWDDVPSSVTTNLMSILVPLGIVNFAEKAGIIGNVRDEGFSGAFDVENTDYAQGLMIFMLEGVGLSTREINIKPSGEEWVLLRNYSQGEFKKAVEDFNSVVKEEIATLRADSDFQELTAEEQYKKIELLSERIKSRTIDRYVDQIPEAERQALEE